MCGWVLSMQILYPMKIFTKSLLCEGVLNNQLNKMSCPTDTHQSVFLSYFGLKVIMVAS